MTNHVDQTARDIANAALAAISSHEKVCAERANSAAAWRVSAADTMERIEGSVTAQKETMSKQFEAVYARFWWIIGGVISGFGSVITLLLARVHL